MNGNFEKYLNEMLEMQRKAAPAQTIQNTAPVQEEKLDENEEVHEEQAESDLPEEKCENNVCSQWAEQIAICEFSVENAADGTPVKNAQVLLFCSNGCFVRTLTDEDGKSGEMPVVAEGTWRVSVTASGYISVSRAIVEPIAGEKTSISVKLDESMSIDGIFTERGDDTLI